jgi:branched-chain amino acid transport system ATP-binding protein
MPMLEVENIHSYYGNIHALKGVSLTVDKGKLSRSSEPMGQARAHYLM